MEKRVGSSRPRQGATASCPRTSLPGEYLRHEEAGVERIISVSAVGSNEGRHQTGGIVIPDQFYDHTKPAEHFLRDGVSPTWNGGTGLRATRRNLIESGGEGGATVHRGARISAWKVRNSPRARSPLTYAPERRVIGMTNATRQSWRGRRRSATAPSPCNGLRLLAPQRRGRDRGSRAGRHEAQYRDVQER